MKKLNHDQIAIHDLLNHLNQVEVICEKSSSKDIIDKINVIREENDGAIYLAKQLQKKMNDKIQSRKTTTQQLESYVCVDLAKLVKDYFIKRDLDISLDVAQGLGLYQVKLNDGLSDMLSNLYKILSLHTDISLRIKVVNGYLLFAFQMTGRNSRSMESFDLELVEHFFEDHSGKTRFIRSHDGLYTRLFLPVIEACPIYEHIAA
jgi:hypothetical protein